MNMSAKDFTEDFAEMLMQSILNAKIEELYGKQLEELYDGWVDALGDNNLTSDEVARLQKQQEELVAKMQKTRDELASATGYGNTESTEQSATANGIEKMTHDDAGVIEGRLTATQIAVEQGNTKKDAILSQATMMNVTMSDIRSIATAQSEIADDTRTILANSYLELREINEHQDKIEKAVVVIQSDVEEMKEDIKDLK